MHSFLVLFRLKKVVRLGILVKGKGVTESTWEFATCSSGAYLGPHSSHRDCTEIGYTIVNSAVFYFSVNPTKKTAKRRQILQFLTRMILRTKCR